MLALTFGLLVFLSPLLLPSYLLIMFCLKMSKTWISMKTFQILFLCCLFWNSICFLCLSWDGGALLSSPLLSSRSGCLEVLLIRSCRAFNPVNNTLLFDSKYAGTPVFKSLGCDDLINAVFELAKGLSRLQLTEEEMALFSAAVLLSPDRPWLTDTQKVQRLQERVYLALQSCLQRSPTSKEKLTKMVSKLPLMKSICNLHMDKLEFFSLVHPDTAYSFPPLYREVFGSEVQYPDSSER
ncbi:UNVERIFIED_CONTAM: hypothetical protein FKN15_016440 [Acipenser sinensis]